MDTEHGFFRNLKAWERRIVRVLAVVGIRRGPLPAQPQDAGRKNAGDLHKPRPIWSARTIMRPVITGHVPLAIVDAPVQGTGKTLLVMTLGTIAVGNVS